MARTIGPQSEGPTSSRATSSFTFKHAWRNERGDVQPKFVCFGVTLDVLSIFKATPIKYLLHI